MPPTRTPRIRLRSHLLADNPAATPEASVAHFGAMQAQDYRGALWAVGVRTRAVDERDVEKAIEARRIIRCGEDHRHSSGLHCSRWITRPGLQTPGVIRRIRA